MRLMFWLWVGATIVTVYAVGSAMGVMAAAAVLGLVVATHVLAMAMAWWDVRTDGYVMEKRPAKDGGRQWWVGSPRGGTVQWLMPGPRAR